MSILLTNLVKESGQDRWVLQGFERWRCQLLSLTDIIVSHFYAMYKFISTMDNVDKRLLEPPIIDDVCHIPVGTIHKTYQAWFGHRHCKTNAICPCNLPDCLLRKILGLLEGQLTRLALKGLRYKKVMLPSTRHGNGFPDTRTFPVFLNGEATVFMLATYLLWHWRRSMALTTSAPMVKVGRGIYHGDIIACNQ